MAQGIDKGMPCFTMSVAARMVGLHAQTLRYYERAGLVRPTRTSGNKRLYSQNDIEKLLKVRRLTQEMGMSLSGAEAMLRMAGRMAHLEERMDAVLHALHGDSEPARVIDVTPIARRGKQSKRGSSQESGKRRAASHQ